MARALKTYRTSIGFYDMVVAVPSMKAALEAWGADSNLFHQGFAREADDADAVAAAKTHPGVVLRRPVGTSGPFKQLPDVPTDLATPLPSKPKTSRQSPAAKIGGRKARAASGALQRKDRERAIAKRKAEAAEARKLERREAAVAKAKEALHEAEVTHANKVDEIVTERSKLDERARAERDRWELTKSKLESAIRKAQSAGRRPQVPRKSTRLFR